MTRVGVRGAPRRTTTGTPLRAALTAIVLVAPSVTGTAVADTDWAKGLVTGTGLGVADRHAPSPAAAREPAHRAAEDAARKQIATQLPKLPLADGGTLEARLAKVDKPTRTALEARLARAVAAAITVDATPQTDGSWVVTLAVPIEAVRQAIAGDRTPTAPDADPPIVIVEGVTAKPAVGYTIGGVAGATLWVTTVPAWATDAPRVKSIAAKPGAIELAAPHGGPATLFLILAR